VSLSQHQGKHRCTRSAPVFSGDFLKGKCAYDGIEWQQNRRDDCCRPAALNHSPSPTTEPPYHHLPTDCRQRYFHLVTSGCRCTCTSAVYLQRIHSFSTCFWYVSLFFLKVSFSIFLFKIPKKISVGLFGHFFLLLLEIVIILEQSSSASLLYTKRHPISQYVLVYPQTFAT